MKNYYFWSGVMAACPAPSSNQAKIAALPSDWSGGRECRWDF